MALHAGTLAALLIGSRSESVPRDRGDLGFGALATAPAGLTGLLLERRIADRLGAPETIVLGLFVGSLALGLADLCPQVRRAEDAGLADALWLGLAQATALMPGVSRSGATLAMARFRHFRRPDAHRLSRRLGVPVIAGATVLKAWRMRDPELAAAAPELAAGALASFLSARLAARLADDGGDARPLCRYAAYRTSLAVLALIRLRRDVSRRPRALGQDDQDQGHAGAV